MRLTVSIVFIIGIVLANQVHAEDFSIQPLTRIDCDKAEMAWDENANVCIAGSGGSRQPLTRLGCEMAGMAWNDNANVCGAALAAEALPKADAANAGFKSPTTDASSQPLTKNQCEKAHMRWNDRANVCGEKSGTQAAATSPVSSSIVVNIDKTKQQMTVFLDGVERYNWPVSTGKSGYSTPSGTFTAMSMNEVWYSKEWDNAPMPHAIFFMKDGHAIHGSYEVKTLGKPVSHGCVRISPQNAATLYDLVAKTGPRSCWPATLLAVKQGWPASREADLVTVRIPAVPTNRSSTITQSHFHSRRGAAGFSGVCLVVSNSPQARVARGYS